MAEKRDRIFCDLSDRPLYDSIFNELFPGLTRSEQFFYAMAYGRKLNSKMELKKREGFFNLKDIKDPADHAIMIAIAIHDTKNADVLQKYDSIYQIAEEYAHAGIVMLKDMRDNNPHGNFLKIIEAAVQEDMNGNRIE